MDEETTPKSSGRLLSKVVKFITRPTTDWADLNRVDSGEAEPSESSLALREMIERKRRNDFVRKREFDMLRKLRRRQLAGGTDSMELSSIASSQVSAQSEQRERIEEKIDQIEQQMSRAWLEREQTTTDAGHAYDKTVPATLTGSGHGLDAVDATSAPASGPGLEAGPTAQPPLEILAEAQPAPAPDDEEEDAVSIGPELEEVAIRFANGDVSGAEASLLDLLSEGGKLCDDVDAWLTLFDLYRAAGEPDKFDGAAIAFVGRFGRSAPQWELLPGAGSDAVPMDEDGAPHVVGGAGGGAALHWVAPSTLGIQSVAALNASLARATPPWRLDWRRLRAIEPDALQPLLETLRGWAEEPVRLRLLGAEQLLAILADHSPSDQRDVDPRWWEARLALLRVMNEGDEFDLVALNYCVTYEMSPPAWEDPRCECAFLDESGSTLPPPEADDERGGRASSGLASLLPGEGLDVLRRELEGVIQDDATAALQGLGITEHTRTIEFNCRRLERVDFGAAGALLNWAAEQQGRGRRVVFRHVNRLVAAFFGVVGISESARVRRRVD
ncbi:MAG TPA: STAS domain-containing protein [Ottowia sp.]|mgnify:CR=1 FL=1|uniref:STAS domain-containing protein n=1 Tax=Ottowia sp. TaxID=1898956 RepID=UPI002CD964C9|nr:STAS domain-containing protein [Ottowia sp.]HMN21273.1 STAS domain-containing protein [Ottowia sp.]